MGRRLLLDARITTLDMPNSGVVLGMAIPSLLFTMFAVGGYAHATNIVDGLNRPAANIIKA